MQVSLAQPVVRSAAMREHLVGYGLPGPRFDRSAAVAPDIPDAFYRRPTAMGVSRARYRPPHDLRTARVLGGHGPEPARDAAAVLEPVEVVGLDRQQEGGLDVNAVYERERVDVGLPPGPLRLGPDPGLEALDLLDSLLDASGAEGRHVGVGGVIEPDPGRPPHVIVSPGPL